MRTRQSGFTLVELLVVSLLTAVVLAGVYETLQVQEKSYEVAGLKIRDQESLRVALGILESELREVGAIGGADIGGTDIAVASADSIVFRAQRNVGFICKLSRADKWAIVWTLGDPFETSDSLLIFVDSDSARFDDDRWDATVTTNAAAETDADCTSYWPEPELQRLKLDNHPMAGVQPGSPIRGFDWITYHLHDFGDQGWGLARSQDSDPNSPALLVSGLAPPGQGLQLQYFTLTGTTTNDPTQIARVRITVRTDPQSNTDIESAQMTTNLYLRNN